MEGFVHITTQTPWKSTLLIRNPNCRRVFFLIGGYNQSSATWNRFQKSIFVNQNDGVAIIERRGEDSREYVGLTSLANQVAEVEAAILWLVRQPEFVESELILIGHSLGGLIAREVTAQNPNIVAGLVQIAPVPPQRFALLRNWSFWRHGGFLAALAAVWGIVNGRGFIPPVKAVRGLFTGPICEEDLWGYMGILTPDSVRVFVELLFFYDGRKAWEQVTKNITGISIVVIAPGDTTIPMQALKDMGRRYVRYLEPGTPHCIQFTDDATWRRTQLTMQNALNCMRT